MRDSALLKQMLEAQQAADKPYGAICASPAVVLESHGLLKGETAVTEAPGAERSVLELFYGFISWRSRFGVLDSYGHSGSPVPRKRLWLRDLSPRRCFLFFAHRCATPRTPLWVRLGTSTPGQTRRS